MNIFKNGINRVHFTINDRFIRFVESGKNNSFIGYGQKCLPEGIIVEGLIKEPEILQMMMEELIMENKLKGKKLSFSVPDSYIILRLVSVPIEINEEEIVGYLYMELGETIHLPFEDPVIEAVDLGIKGTQREVLLIASKESILNEYTEMFESVSLKPEIADLSMLSLYRLYYHLNVSKEEEHLLMIQIGLDNMLLSVFHQRKPLLLSQFKLPFDGSQYEIIRNRRGQEFFTWNGKGDQFDTLSAEVLVEIERFMTYYKFNFTQGSHEVTKLLIAGDHPHMTSFQEKIVSTVDLQFESLLKPLFQTKKKTNIPPVYAECIGLALR
ncbi:type IV pilus assembly protein PilM [Peribacillus deserti]|uniref:Type IV pilus assembly protein PilM n=1 Tax=Peribacillus deserti TaxID=673318 RepID=A0ABS2QHD4_9BACI|nr:pilus assembly protein PilM [Peribacillus deserti]MBM7691928.1 type IV pilus assembly protein PilM [Peribacillus deserti]